MLGFQFCEPQKQICRKCSDFQEYCWKDILHIANCSSYCQSLLPRDKDNQELWIYIPSVAFVLLSLGNIVYFGCRKYKKMKKNMSRNTNKEEVIKMLRTESTAEKDTVINLTETDCHDNQTTKHNCPQFNQIPATNDGLEKHIMMTSGTTLQVHK